MFILSAKKLYGQKEQKPACTIHTLVYSPQSLWKIFSPPLPPSPSEKEEGIMATVTTKSHATKATSVLVSVPEKAQ